MPSPARTAGQLGRLPVKPAAERFPIRYLSAYLREPIPAPAYPVDVTGGIADDAWGVLGNGLDPSCTSYPGGVGDCGFAGREHYRYAKAACYGEQEPRESSDELVAEYLAYDGGQDAGVNLADVLLAWYKAGKILGFAPVNHADPAEVDAVMQAFRGVYCGVNLTSDAQQLFGAGQPWTVADGEQPDPSAGHCIVKVRADGHQLDSYVTWGHSQSATRDWSSACLEEAWAVITSEDEAARVDMAALVADIEALHGTPPQPPAPAPAPPPAPVPVPVDHKSLLEQLAGHVREVAASEQQDITELLAFLASNGL